MQSLLVRCRTTTIRPEVQMYSYQLPRPENDVRSSSGIYMPTRRADVMARTHLEMPRLFLLLLLLLHTNPTHAIPWQEAPSTLPVASNTNTATATYPGIPPPPTPAPGIGFGNGTLESPSICGYVNHDFRKFLPVPSLILITHTSLQSKPLHLRLLPHLPLEHPPQHRSLRLPVLNNLPHILHPVPLRLLLHHQQHLHDRHLNPALPLRHPALRNCAPRTSWELLHPSLPAEPCIRETESRVDLRGAECLGVFT